MPRRITTLLGLLAAATQLLCSPAQAQKPGSTAKPAATGPMKVATTPAPRLGLDWWKSRHQNKLAKKAKRLAAGEKIRLVFVGDSITHGWEKAGKEIWRERFAPYGAMNLGYSGDRTEHVLWRLGLEGSDSAGKGSGSAGKGEQHNEVAGLTPDLYVVMIGTNNTGHHMAPADATAAGVTAIVDRLQQLSPKSRVLLLAIFPRGAKATDPQRQRNEEINQRLASLDEQPQVTFLNINQAFLDEQGGLPKSIMPDRLHPRMKGYQIWADAIKAEIEKHLGPPTAAASETRAAG